MRALLWLLTSPLVIQATSQEDLFNDADLLSYVSRPDLKPPRLNISVYDAAAIIPGYWFIAPYNSLHGHSQSSVYQPLQMGPHIYDSQGELVWSGAHLFPRRAVHDFRAHDYDTPELTFILDADMTAKEYHGGIYVTLGEDYKVRKTFGGKSGEGIANIHEFKKIHNGSLVTSSTPRYYVSPSYGMDHDCGWLRDGGFQEIDEEGVPVFAWWALDHLKTVESHRQHSLGAKSDPDQAWDFFHANSIEKTNSGDYLLSARDTSTIYLISGEDGRILWRLGGKYSNFTMSKTFSAQHDARVISDNTTTMVISLLDNAASIDDMGRNSSATSSALLLALDKSGWTATILRSYPRPDKGLTLLRGNFQWHPSGASLAHWSDNNYFCEYDAEGRMVLEAQLSSHRFESYRTYKFNWISRNPVEKPVIKSFAYGTEPSRAITTLYVSWNGATEVATWKFYGIANGSEGLIAVTPRTKFESVAMADGYFERAKARAFDVHGNELGSSAEVDVEIPLSWNESHEGKIEAQKAFEIASATGERGDEWHSISSGVRPQILPTPFTVVNLAMNFSEGGVINISSLFPLFALMVLASGSTVALVRRRRRRRPIWRSTP